MEEIKTLADTIIYVAKERQKSKSKYQNLNSAIHSVVLDVQQLLMEFMKENK